MLIIKLTLIVLTTANATGVIALGFKDKTSILSVDTAKIDRPDVDIDGGTGISIEADNNADASIVLKTNNATGVITDSKDKASILG